MDGFSRDIAPESEGDAAPSKRTRGRDSLFLTATFGLVGEPPREVRIRNLSEGGLMAELGRALAVGTAVTLELRNIGKVTGSVAWSAEGRVGIALDAPIDPLRVRKPVGNGTTTPVFAKALKRL